MPKTLTFSFLHIWVINATLFLVDMEVFTWISREYGSFRATLFSPFKFHANSSLCFVFIILCCEDHICSQLLLFTTCNMIYKHMSFISHCFLDNSVLALCSSARLNHLRIDIILVYVGVNLEFQYSGSLLLFFCVSLHFSPFYIEYV